MNKEKDMANYAVVFFVFLSALLLIFPSSKIAHSARIIVGYSLNPSLHYGSKYEYYARNVPENFLALLRTDQENRALKDKIKELEIYRQSAAAVFDENARLSSALGLSGRLPWKGVWARVINKDPSDWYGSFFIDKGARQGVEQNDMVLGFENGRAGLAGRIFEVSPDFSKALLVTNDLSSVICSPEKGGFTALAEGKGTWLLKMNYVPEDSALAAGAELFTSGGGLLFPGGVYLGRVIKVYPKESFMNFITADITPAVNVNNLREVLVVKRNSPYREEKRK
ncbi:MAG: rod shape-determining protein MreC [Elusimicrobia bacterium]|nr:rod shape-determining protein MreC [Elusimicrobiota bacterium]